MAAVSAAETYAFEPEERVNNLGQSGHLFNIIHFADHEIDLQPRFSRHGNRQFLFNNKQMGEKPKEQVDKSTVKERDEKR